MYKTFSSSFGKDEVILAIEVPFVSTIKESVDLQCSSTYRPSNSILFLLNNPQIWRVFPSGFF